MSELLWYMVLYRINAIIFRIIVDQSLFLEYMMNGTTATLQSHVKQGNVDMALIIGLNLDVYKAFQVTSPISNVACHWILPEKTQSFLTILQLHGDVLLYYALLHFLLFLIFCLLPIYKESIYISPSNSWLILTKMCLYQSFHIFPKVGWFRYFILFYIVVATNLNITIQSYLKSLIVAPHVDKSIKTFDDLVLSDIPLLYHQGALRILIDNLNDEKRKILKDKSTFWNKSVELEDILISNKYALLLNDLTITTIDNRKYLLKIPQVGLNLKVVQRDHSSFFLEKYFYPTAIYHAQGTPIGEPFNEGSGQF